MKKIHLILILALCVVVAVLGIGYFASDSSKGKDDDNSSDDSVKSVSSEEYEEEVGFIKQDESEADKPALKPNEEKNTAEKTSSEKDTTEKQTAEEKTTAKKPSGETTTKKEDTSSSDYEYAYAGFNPTTVVINEEKWNLLLVNRNYILPDDFTVKTAPIKGGSMSMDYRVVPYYDQMVTAAEKDGITLIPVSGYRSVERQRTNFENEINYYVGQGYSKAEATRLASEVVLMPATSEHNAGLAMDFGTTGNTSLDESFANTKAFKWLCENAADYGFILRYEEHTQDITMITYEPWHWRYVGVEAAKEIKASGVTLEEYLGMD